MKLRPLIIFLSLILLHGLLPAKAQIAGYLGKHLIAGYQFGLGTDITFEGRYLNPKHTVHADYIVGRKSMLGGELTFMSVSYPAPDFGYIDWPNPVYDLNFSFVQMGAVCTFYGFGSDALAPLGDFFQIKLFRTLVKASDPVGYTIEYDPAKQVPYERTSLFAGLGLVYGHSKIIWDRVLLTASVDANLYRYLGTKFLGDYIKVTDGITGEGAISAANMFSLRLGVAGLLF